MLRLLLLAALAPLLVQVSPARAGDTCGAEQAVDVLVGLVHERLVLAEDVARYKWNHQRAIEDLPREQAIIASLGRRTAAQGLPVPWAEAFFRAQIEASKAEQRVLFARWRAAGITRFRQVPDLIADTRPKLDQLTSRMISALAEVWPHLADPGCGTMVARQVAALGAAPSWHDPEALRVATAPLAEVAQLAP